MASKILILIVAAFAILMAINITKISNYSDKHPILDEIKRRFIIINPKYDKIPLRIGSESFTEDKFAITLCIADPNTGQYYDINTLMYVALHELSHIHSKASGNDSHNDEFKENFAKLLKIASKKGVYDARQPIPEAYCGGPRRNH